jgi:hypothetical protein
MKFSLIQLLICIALILLISFVLISYFGSKPTETTLPQQPGVTIPFTNLKISE